MNSGLDTSQIHFTSVNDPAQIQWDSESRKSAYSTVADPDDDTYCEACDSDVVYSGPNDKYGTCKCDGQQDPSHLCAHGFADSDDCGDCHKSAEF